MTDKEILKIKEHIDIHARREPYAIKITEILKKAVDELELTKELKHLLALWENAVCEIRAENKASENNAHIAHICDKLESSMHAYAHGNVEYAHFAI